MDDEERTALKAAIKDEVRPLLAANVEEAERVLKDLGTPALRVSVIRELKANVVDQVTKLWATDRGGFSLSDDEFRIRMEVFNEVMDEMLAKSFN